MLTRLFLNSATRRGFVAAQALTWNIDFGSVETTFEAPVAGGPVTGLVVTLAFPAGEAVRIPIIKDRVHAAGVTTVGKFIKRTAQLPLVTKP